MEAPQKKPSVQRLSPVRPLDLEALKGKSFPWNPKTRAPMFLATAEASFACFMIFSDESALHTMMKHLSVGGYTIEKLDDVGLLQSIPSAVGRLPLKVVIDPHVTPDGKLQGTYLVDRN